MRHSVLYEVNPANNRLREVRRDDDILGNASLSRGEAGIWASSRRIAELTHEFHRLNDEDHRKAALARRIQRLTDFHDNLRAQKERADEEHRAFMEARRN